MKRYSDSTLMRLTKEQLIEEIRIAERRQDVAEERLCQQAENLKDWAPVRHASWDEYCTSRFCGFDECNDPIYRDGVVYLCSDPRCRRKTVVKEKYCPSCGAKMDGGDNDGKMDCMGKVNEWQKKRRKKMPKERMGAGTGWTQ